MSPEVSETDIAIVGLSGRFAGARNVSEYWRNLRDGIESITLFEEAELRAAGVDPRLIRDPEYIRSGFVLKDMEMFDPAFFGFSPKEAAIMDPQHRNFLECAWEAMEVAGHVPRRFGGSIAVYAGCGMNNYMIYNLLTNPDLVRSEGMFLLRHTGNDKDFLATRVSYELNLTGPSVNVQTACSTSLVAIHLAVQSLLNGECEMALAGGVTIKQPHRIGYKYEEGGVSSPDGHCRAFDQDAQGTVFGSGAGVVVLRRLREALEDGDTIHAVIKGSAINNDGSAKVGYLAPSIDRQAAAAAEALAIAGVEPESVSYLETHGTGTPVGDPIEIMALTQAYGAGTDRTGFCAIGSVKTNIGHTDTAAGVASVIKVVEALKHRELPPSLNFAAPNPVIDFERSPFYVNDRLRPWNGTAPTPLRAGINSLGVGGTNAHLILEEAPVVASGGSSRQWQLLPLSARNGAALDRARRNLADHLRSGASSDLADVAYTLQLGRETFSHRRVVVATDADGAAELLEADDPKRSPVQVVGEAEPSVAMMFSGGGAQYPAMGVELYRTEAVYRQEVDRSLDLLRRHVDFDLRPLLYPLPGDEARAAGELERPSRALPALFITQYALAKLWMSWGIEPRAMIGHSMGEYTAAHLAGVFSLDDALALVSLRGRLFETVPEGGMLSVPLSAEELREEVGSELSIAAINAPELCVASGPTHALDDLARRLEEREVECHRIRISIAAHSAMLEPILRPFEDFFRRITLNAPRLPFVSNVTGTWITAAEAQDPSYWVRHLRHTVRFADGVQVLLEEPGRVLLEVGPGRVLTTLARLHPSIAPSHAVLQSMRHPGEEGSDVAFALGALGRLWMQGVEPDWKAFWGQERRRRVPLPTYSFERQRCWIEPGRQLAMLADDGEPYKREDVAEWFYQPSWKRTVPPTLPADPASERVLVFHDEQGLSDRLAARLADLGHDVVHVRSGAGYRRVADREFVLGPSHAGDYDSLLDALAGDGLLPRRIVYARTVTGPDALSPDDRALADLENRSFYGLLFLAQAIGRADLSDAISLAVVSNGMHQVAGESDLSPVKALAIGPCRVIAAEFPNIDCRGVDVVLPTAPGWQEKRQVEQLVAEIFAPSEESIVAYRGADRWVQSYEAVTLPTAPPARVREGGTYLITGGLGGIALEVAEDLARAARVNLVLMARSSLPPRSEWAGWIEARGEEDRTSRRIRKVEAIEALGSEVMLVAADVSDAASVEAAVREVRARFGAIHGAVHTAGVLNDGLILAKEPQGAALVLAPKVRGTLVLDQALADEPLDFFVLFSSRSSVSGIVGQVDYAAANAFLDAFAHFKSSLQGAPVVAVGWSAWAEVGMVAEMSRPAESEDSAPADHPLLDRRVRTAAAEEVYATDFALGRSWVLDDHRLRSGLTLIPGTGYLEMVRAAYSQRPRGEHMEISDVFFISPFVLHPGEQKQLRVELRGNGDGHEFVIRGRNGGGWHEHATGHVAGRPASEPRVFPLDEIRARCNQREEVFTTREREHLDLGKRWESLRTIRYGQGEALASLELPAEFADELDVYQLHPALLDVATGCAQPLIPGFDERKDFFVPASYTRLLTRGPLPQRGYSYVRYRTPPGQEQDMAVFDVTILDERGVEVVDVSEFVMVRVTDKAALDAAPASASHGAAEAEPSPADTLVVDLSEAIRPAEGTDALRRILAAGSLSQVIVSPQDLHAWIRHLRRRERPEAGQRTASAKPAAPVTEVPEVAALLLEHDAVGEAVVLARPDRDSVRLVAYVVYRPDEFATVSELRRYLRQHLPEDQVPQNFLELDAMPARADGSVDVAALPDPFGAADDYVAPRTDAERTIAAIWAELLGVERVSIHDNFLDIGGHSLLALRAINRIAKKTGVRVSPSALNLQTLEQIAAQFQPAPTADESAPPAAPAAPAAPAREAEPVPAPDDAPSEAEPRQRALGGRFLSAVMQTITRS